MLKVVLHFKAGVQLEDTGPEREREKGGSSTGQRNNAGVCTSWNNL